MRRCLHTFVALLASLSGAFGQLSAGDVAIVAYSSDSPDAFAWVALTDVPADTVLHFTDSSVSNGLFYWPEHLDSGAQSLGKGGPLSWSCTSDVPRGTVISFSSATTNWSLGVRSGNYPVLSASGDQLFVYTNSIAYNSMLGGDYKGDPNGAVMLYGVDFGNAGWSSAGGPTESSVPTGLSTNAGTAVYLGNRDNGYYSGIRTGVVADLRQAIANPVNWTTSDSYLSPSAWPDRFEVLPETALFEFSGTGPLQTTGGGT